MREDLTGSVRFENVFDKKGGASGDEADDNCGYGGSNGSDSRKRSAV